MLKQLRRKFITLNMATVAVVLVAVFGTVCYLDWQNAHNDVRQQLTDQAARGQAIITRLVEEITAPVYPGQWDDGGPGARHEIGGLDGNSPEFPVAVYLLTWEIEDGDDDGIDDAELTLISMASNAEVSEDIAEDLAEAAAKLDDGFARLGSFGLYCARNTVDGFTVVAFCDTSTTDNWKSLALIFVLVGIATLAVFFVISLFFSRWALKPVAEAWEREHRFVADVSHDLKTPIAVILANNAILRDSPEATVTEMSQWVESTETEALEMKTMVNDMLELARFDAADSGQTQVGAKAANALDLDFSSIVEAQALMFESVAYDRGLTLDAIVAPGCTVHGQAPQITRLASSLIDNACKYTPEGGRISVALEKSADGKHAVYTVNNTGAVISPEDLPHLFDRFYRTDAARTGGDGASTASGHGLGLAIAKSIAETHGGTLAAESDTAHGTTFTATLPLA